MSPVVPSPDQLPFFEELAPPTTAARQAGRTCASSRRCWPTSRARQRKAVTHGDGPLLIVAGAGTGKTTVITRRIAWLIAEKRAKPSEILALTFTDRAAVRDDRAGRPARAVRAQRRADRHLPRLRRPAPARARPRGGPVATARPSSAGRSRSSSCASTSSSCPLDRYRPLGDPTRFLSALVTLFSRLRDEDVSPDAYLPSRRGA